MNLVFAGTPDFAVPTLQALLDAGHAIAAVYTQPDRPAGRGRTLQPGPVKTFAIGHDLPIRQPLSLKSTSEAEALRTLQPDALIVVAYGLILPPAILAVPRYGSINVHASLLPRWRGAAPIQRAIEAGDTETGITIMQMDAGLDTGAILARESIPITATDNAATLHDRLAVLGGSLLVKVLAQLETGALTPEPQDASQATYASKLKKEEARLDWHNDATHLERQIRAFNPWPVAHTTLAGQSLRLWQARAEAAADGTPGTLLSANAEGLRVQCAHGVLCITRLQPEGGKIMEARDFVNGRPLPAGTCFGT